MTRKEAIELRPYSAGVYVAALLFYAFFAWIRFGITPHHPHTDTWASGLLLILIIFCGAQAASRLLLPVATAKLSRKLATYSNLEHTLVRTTVLAVVILLLIGLIRGMHSDVRLLANTCMMLPFSIADMFGKDSPYTRQGPSRSETIPLWRNQLKPIHSDQWGNR